MKVEHDGNRGLVAVWFVVLNIYASIATKLLNAAIDTAAVMIPVQLALWFRPGWELVPIISSHKFSLAMCVMVFRLLWPPARLSPRSQTS